MSVSERLYELALGLPPLERERLALRLLASLETPSVESDQERVAEWNRRVERWERGETQDMDAWEAMARLRAQFPTSPSH